MQPSPEKENTEQPCYICWDASETEGNPIRRDCGCKGANGYVHMDCLVASIKAKTIDDPLRFQMKCNQCQKQYTSTTRNRLSKTMGGVGRRIQNLIAYVAIQILAAVVVFGAFMIAFHCAFSIAMCLCFGLALFLLVLAAKAQELWEIASKDLDCIKMIVVFALPVVSLLLYNSYRHRAALQKTFLLSFGFPLVWYGIRVTTTDLFFKLWLGDDLGLGDIAAAQALLAYGFSVGTRFDELHGGAQAALERAAALRNNHQDVGKDIIASAIDVAQIFSFVLVIKLLIMLSLVINQVIVVSLFHNNNIFELLKRLGEDEVINESIDCICAFVSSDAGQETPEELARARVAEYVLNSIGVAFDGNM